METSNEKRARLLGQPYGTATAKLRKLLLFEAAKRLDEDTCYRCNTKITAIDEFSIEHTIPWQGTENPIETFFDTSKIAYSHLSCNSRAAYRPWSKALEAPEGTLWCTKGKHYQPIEIFHSNISRDRGKSDSCAPCDILAVDTRRRARGLRPVTQKFSKVSKYNKPREI